ncbi:MAG: outer membrane protein assembly factor BamA [Planctomycetota bacterium]|nr:outer membrane protein assembly factor BamA [Planctomycetota bacterium]
MAENVRFDVGPREKVRTGASLWRAQAARLGHLLPATLSVVLALACLQAPGPRSSGAAWGGEAPPPPEPAGDENEGKSVQEIEIRGLVRLDEGTVLRLIRTRKGRPFERKVWDEDWHRLDESGYFLNVRTTEPIIYPGGVKLAIDLVEKASISKVTFKGNTSAGASKLLTIIKSYEGGRYDKGQVHLDKGAIEKYYQEKAFRSVKVEYQVETVSSHRQQIGGKEVEVEDEVRVIFTVDEGSPVGVRSIHFVGNKAFSESALRGAISTKHRRLFRAGDLKDEELDLDKKRLEAFYLRHGYMDVSVEKVDVNVSKESYWNWFRKRKRLADIVFNINEGPQYFTGTVSITGNSSIERDELEAVMKVKPGAVYSDMLLQDDHEALTALYGERGRVFTKVEYDRKLVTDLERLKKTPNIYDVFVTVKESPEVTLREVITRGNTKTRDKVIIRQMELFPGDRIDTTKMKIAQQRLKNLNYFEDDVRITPEPTENPEEANLIIDVKEKSTGEFNFGVGVSSVDSIIGNIRLTQRNFDYSDLPKSWRDFISGNAFVGAGQTFSIEATGGAKRQRYSISFFEPWAFDRPIRTGGSLFRTVDRYSDFEQTSSGFTASVGKRLWGPHWDGDLNYRFSYTEIGGISKRYPPILREQEGARLLSSVQPRLVYDSRDSRLLPSRGFMAEASLEIGGGPFFGDYNWVRPQLDVARYLTIYKMKSGGKHIIELRGRATMVEGYCSTSDVPPFLRYYGGGIDTIRGFQWRTVTPLENGYQIGGKKMVLGTAEYSLPLYEEIVRGSIFADTGTVYDAGDTDPHTRLTNESGWRASVGLGLSIRTPLSPLPIRVYLSRPVLRNDEDRTKTIDFTFGTRF